MVCEEPHQGLGYTEHWAPGMGLKIVGGWWAKAVAKKEMDSRLLPQNTLYFIYRLLTYKHVANRPSAPYTPTNAFTHHTQRITDRETTLVISYPSVLS